MHVKTNLLAPALEFLVQQGWGTLCKWANKFLEGPRQDCGLENHWHRALTFIVETALLSGINQFIPGARTVTNK